MSIHQEDYFKQNLTHSLVKPFLAGGVVFAYSYFTDNSREKARKDCLSIRSLN